jgi:hypothetical protein
MHDVCPDVQALCCYIPEEKCAVLVVQVLLQYDGIYEISYFDSCSATVVSTCLSGQYFEPQTSLLVNEWGVNEWATFPLIAAIIAFTLASSTPVRF